MLLLGCAQMPTSHVLSNIVSFVSKNMVSLADSSLMYCSGCVSRYHCWDMNEYGISCAVLPAGAWACSNARFACFQSNCQFHYWEHRKSCGFDLYVFQRMWFSYYSWGMSGCCVSCVVLSVIGWVCSDASMTPSE